MFRLSFLLVFLQLMCSLCPAQTPRGRGPMPFQSPAVSRSHLAFVYAGSVWVVDRGGGEARRLTTVAGDESTPFFSPDGSLVAFSKTTGGNTDVYVAPVAGGDLRRLTFHPEIDLAGGWTPDGRNVLFRSTRDSAQILFTYRFYTVPAAGGSETALPLPTGASGSFSPDGASIAYTPYRNLGEFWRNYRGGRTTPILIARLSDSSTEEIPRRNSNDYYPMWIGDTIYFVSDRTLTANLFAYDLRTRKMSQLTRYEKYDIRSASAGGGVIAFVREGAIHLYDPQTDQTRPVEIRIGGDFAEVKPRRLKAERWLYDYNLSPAGTQVVFEARGEVLTFDGEKGTFRNLTQSSGVAERSPVWSPDGKAIAYFSDESGEYSLHVRAAVGEGGVRKISIEAQPSFYNEPVWSPDSRKIAFSDKRLALWYVDVDTGAAHRIDASTFARQGAFQPAWSPDSRWLAYSKTMPNRLSVIHLYSLETGKSQPVTGRNLEAGNPVFDRNGQYLYFNASTNAAPAKLHGVSMSAALVYAPLVTQKVYAVVLQKDGNSPLVPLKDQANAARDLRSGIDLENIDRRILPLPFPTHNFADLAAGRPGVLFILGKWVDTSGGESPPTRTLYKFDLATRKYEKYGEDIREYRVSVDGGRLLYPKAGSYWLVSADAPPKAEEGKLDLSRIEFELDPRAEWRQMFDEAWRIERDYLYYPDLHGQNLAALKEKYAAYLPGVVTRNDLNTLFREMLSHVAISHLSITGGDVPAPAETSRRENTGVLGADYRIEEGRYRITHIYSGDNSSPALRGPLSQPGVQVKEGDYLLAVDGDEVRAAENLYQYFRGKAGKPVELKVAAQAGGAGARTFTVVPVASDSLLRDFERVEGNRRRVRELSGDKLAYVYLPNVQREGYEIFNREFYAQLDKQGLIIDERFNAGGYGSDHIIDALRRQPLNAYAFRDGARIAFPADVMPGPRVMLTSEFAGSGGDSLPWLFRQAGLGVLVGKRTAGFGIGHYVNVPNLLDGGDLAAPNRAFLNPRTGEFEIENKGVTPDIEVAWTAADWRSGRDVQLERAVRAAMDALNGIAPKKAARVSPGRDSARGSQRTIPAP
ncbi:MAG TPA: PDZ domain-containing protein [Pyrinomonadaceae bacterium]|jgi:tricorn protease